MRRWDASTEEAIGEPMDVYSSLVTTVVVSDDGRLIVTEGRDTSIRRCDARTGKAIGKPIEGHSGDISTLAISTDGNLIVSGTEDESIGRWNARTGEEIGYDIKVPGPAGNLAICNDGETIACGSEYVNYILKWETMYGKTMKWSESVRILEEMERARLCGDRECDAGGRKDTFPAEMSCRAVFLRQEQDCSRSKKRKCRSL